VTGLYARFCNGWGKMFTFPRCPFLSLSLLFVFHSFIFRPSCRSNISVSGERCKLPVQQALAHETRKEFQIRGKSLSGTSPVQSTGCWVDSVIYKALRMTVVDSDRRQYYCTIELSVCLPRQLILYVHLSVCIGLAKLQPRY